LSKRLSIGQIAAEISSGRNINDSKHACIFVRISRYHSAYRIVIISIASARDKLLIFTFSYFVLRATLMIYELSWTCVLPLAIESLHDPTIARNFGITPRSSKVANIMYIVLECIRIADVYHLRKKLINTLTDITFIYLALGAAVKFS